ncbi:hypothetical protein C3747_102g112 [Trypanosoma cruzi]|uniref:J domain-containing protein n=2 Tax=Trypanosoma cruzi TaxID=5693 RepID=Q4CWT5_TRYCC|nr:hypothetical protein, conserved [Trypanosoma cruzi]EAN84738.1 hypothetical protein, conserved [Trypanosoma cruzi]PWV07413.1 hypothetical protein C3747_102g112 [Trypanosoma cruzi]RNC42243.1 hypothetical protein TcCL_NonESM08135 [Trypanosoma cruzi]|eukprot:XP_806589.1 hypothetical protein [Trypanosoma cruzi strain CL Brener]
MLRACRRFCAAGAAAAPTSADIAAAFRVLGLDAGNPQHATSERVRAQYLHLARLHHPDLSSGDDQKMKVVNTAYEMLQRSGVLNAPLSKRRSEQSAEEKREGGGTGETRFAAKAKLRRRRVPDDFADGDTWSMKSTLEWETWMNSTFGLNSVSDEELRNPANHPFSHSKFFTFEDDTAIYRMLRGGATVRQVARTLGKSPTFVERRLHNAQFKQRIQYVLRHERRLRQQPQQGAHSGGKTKTTAAAATAGGDGRRKKEWEPTIPNFDSPTFFEEMSLEEKGIHAGLLREEERQQHVPLSWTRVASKVGQSYANYARFAGKPRSKP